MIAMFMDSSVLSPSPQLLFFFPLATSFVALIGICIYRVKYHPLAKYPGPLAAKLTNLYGAYYALRGDLHLDMHRCHQKYGSIVRYGPDRLLINSSTALHDIYDHSKSLEKSKAFATLSRILGGQSLSTIIDKPLHRSRRRLITQGFSPERLAGFEPIMLGHIRTFCDQLLATTDACRDWWTWNRNIKAWCNWLAFDIGGELVFGQNFRTLTNIENRFITHAVLALNRRNGVYAQCPGLAWFHLELLWSPIDLQTSKKWLRWGQDVGGKLKTQEKTTSSLFSTVLGAKDPETGNDISYPELIAEAQTLLVAAFETTATTLAATLFYFAHFPVAYSKLAHEIRSTFSDAEDIMSGPKLNTCRYLSACIQESLRMSPSVPGAMWREAELGGLDVDGEYIPAGYEIGTCIYAVHHNEAYFPDSYNFLPERWLSDGPTPDSQAVHSAFHAFSSGPRSCIGRSFALTELSITLARVMWLMDFRLCATQMQNQGGGSPDKQGGRNRADEYQIYSHLTSWSEGPMLEFRERKIDPAAEING